MSSSRPAKPPPLASGVPPVIGRAAQPNQVVPPKIGVRPPPLPRILKGRGRTRRRPPVTLLTPDELDRFKDLLVFARSTVEGYFSGKHKSPERGTSAEFADYKEYVAGDDVTRLDWRLYGRSRRLYVRQFEEETDMVIYLLVDVSGSMDYAGTGRQSKYVLAAKIAAALAYLVIHQGDKAALALFADTVTQYLPPGGTRRQLFQMVKTLEQVEPASRTGLAQALQEAHRLFRKRGRLVVLSDFLVPPDPFLEALGQFQHREFEVLLLQLVDPDELELPPVNVARFEDMETGEEVEVDTDEIRGVYRRTVADAIRDLADEADRRRIRHAQVRTDRPYLDALEAYLGFRGRAP